MNSTINYYNKGAIAGMLLDIAIRKRTANQKSLDDVMRLMYQRYADKEGFTNLEFAAVASEVAGSDLSGWFQRSIHSTEELDYTEALEWLGLQFSAAGPKEGATEGKENTENETKDSAIWFGATVESKDGKFSISRITEHSPAFLAGLNVGDEVIGVDGFRLLEPIDERLKQYKVGEKVSVLVSRRGKLVELPVSLQAKPAQTWKLEIVKTPSPLQSESLSSWLHQPIGK